jgi:hypothetical protein
MLEASRRQSPALVQPLSLVHHSQSHSHRNHTTNISVEIYIQPVRGPLRDNITVVRRMAHTRGMHVWTGESSPNEGSLDTPTAPHTRCTRWLWTGESSCAHFGGHK